MAGSVMLIDDVCAWDTILNVKKRVFALNFQFPVRRQRLVYTTGPRGMDPLADHETLGRVGVSQDGTAELDVLLVDLTAAEAYKLGRMV